MMNGYNTFLLLSTMNWVCNSLYLSIQTYIIFLDESLLEMFFIPFTDIPLSIHIYNDIQIIIHIIQKKEEERMNEVTCILFKDAMPSQELSPLIITFWLLSLPFCTPFATFLVSFLYTQIHSENLLNSSSYVILLVEWRKKRRSKSRFNCSSLQLSWKEESREEEWMN